MLAFHTRKEAVLPQSPQALFSIVAEPGCHPVLAGSGEVRSVRVLTPGPVGRGTQFEANEDIPMGLGPQRFVATSEIVAYDAPHHVSWLVRPPFKPQPRRIQWWFHLLPAAGGTRVTHEVEVDFNPVLNVVFKLPYRLMRGHRISRGMDQTLANLQRLAAEPAPAAAQARVQGTLTHAS